MRGIDQTNEDKLIHKASPEIAAEWDCFVSTFARHRELIARKGDSSEALSPELTPEGDAIVEQIHRLLALMRDEEVRRTDVTLDRRDFPLPEFDLKEKKFHVRVMPYKRDDHERLWPKIEDALLQMCDAVKFLTVDEERKTKMEHFFEFMKALVLFVQDGLIPSCPVDGITLDVQKARSSLEHFGCHKSKLLIDLHYEDAFDQSDPELLSPDARPALVKLSRHIHSNTTREGFRGWVEDPEHGYEDKAELLGKVVDSKIDGALKMAEDKLFQFILHGEHSVPPTLAYGAVNPRRAPTPAEIVERARPIAVRIGAILPDFVPEK